MATRKEYDGYDAATGITSNDLIKYKDGTSGKVYKITEANLSAQVQDDFMASDYKSTDGTLADNSDDVVPTEKAVKTYADGIDPFNKDTTSTLTYETDFVTVEKGGTKYTMTAKNLAIQLKGYKEYTFAIRQSGTYAPTISVIKDDFGLETPLTFTRAGGQGSYLCDITSLDITKGPGVNLFISGNILDLYNGSVRYVFASILSNTQLSVKTATITDGAYNSIDNVLTDEIGCIISIRETLT